jgi:hypothetical protein
MHPGPPLIYISKTLRKCTNSPIYRLAAILRQNLYKICMKIVKEPCQFHRMGLFVKVSDGFYRALRRFLSRSDEGTLVLGHGNARRRQRSRW